MLPLNTWQRLLEPAYHSLVDAAAAVEAQGTSAAAMTKLRTLGDAALVAAALDLAKARRKAAAKFNEDTASTLVADPSGVEMATSALAGAYKASRYMRMLGAGASIIDLCCGIGGDAMAMHAAGLSVMGVDSDPCRAWMAAHNAGVPTMCADVLDDAVRAKQGAFHIDPARREEGKNTGSKRLFRYADLVPGPDVIERIIRERRHWGGGGVKLGPGVDAQELPTSDQLGVPTQLELISERGRLTQAVLWTGDLADGADKREEIAATALRESGVFTIRGSPGSPAVDDTGRIGRFLFEPDPAAERARLLGAVCERFGVREFCPGLGLLTSDDNPCESLVEARAWLGSNGKGFEVVEEMPWRMDSVKAWLEDRRYRVSEVKTRGQTVDPNAVQRVLDSGKVVSNGGQPVEISVFVLRLGRVVRAVLTRRKRGGFP